MKIPRLQTKKIVKKIKKNEYFQKASKYWQEHRLRSLAVVFVFFVLFLIASVIFKQEEPVPEIATKPALAVKALRYGESTLTEKTVGTITNSTTITLVSQSAGPVSKIYKTEGDQVWRGNVITQQETAYGAGSAQAISAQIAQKSLEIAKETLANTQEVVDKTRQQANENRDNTEELRKISEKSIDDTKGIISTTEQVIEKLENDIATEQAGASDPDVIQGFRTQLVSFKGILAQNRSALRNVEYSVDTDNPPTDLANLQRDLIHKTTELQLTTARLQTDIANLNLRAARIAQAATRVSAPFEGTIEKIYVEEGQYLSPGTPVAVIRGKTDLQLKVNVSGALVSQIDDSQPLTIKVDGHTISLNIDHISNVPVNGQLFELTASVPATYQNLVFEQQAVDVTLPLYAVSALAGNHFLPLDSVFVTNLNTYVFVVEDGRAKQKIVETGEIVGESMEIETGLVPGDIIILDRRVIEGQLVEPQIIKTTSDSNVELG